MRNLTSSLTVLLCSAVVACSSDKPTGANPPPPPAPPPPPPPPPPPGPVPNYIQLRSDAGDYVGAGRSYDYTQANAVITLTANGASLQLGLRGDQWWNALFAMPTTKTRLETGVYAALRFNDATHAGLDWGGEGRGCNTISGTLNVDSLNYAVDVLKTIDLHFEQHCEGGAPALRGTVHWRSDDTTKAPGPVHPIPATLWKPAPGATPPVGTYVYLNSDAGDYIGLGQVLTYTSNIAVTETGGLLTVNVANLDWTGSFQTMNTINTLQVGYYGDLIRYPFHNPTKGGLSWSGQGRGCNTLTGWFAVDTATYVNNVLTRLYLRFEQHCEGGSAALHGAMHWTKP